MMVSFALSSLATSVLLCVAAAQAPPLSPIHTLLGDSLVGAAAGTQDQPQVARGGDRLLAVWQDSRTDLSGNLVQDEGGIDVYAARLDSAGRVLDATPIVVRQAPGDQKDPRVAWNGSDWLVVWMSQVATQFYWTYEVQAARVSIDGVVLDNTPIVIHALESSANGELWDVANAGSEWAVFWKDFVGVAWQVRAARIGPDGTPIDASPVDLFSAPSQPYNGTAVFAQDQYLVVWNHWGGAGLDDVFGQRITTNLMPIGGRITIAGDDDYDVWPALATDGRDFFVAWENYNTCCAGGGGKTFGARVSRLGQVLDPGGILLSATTSVTIGRRPGAAFDGSNWLASWSYDAQFGSERIHAARVAPAGVVLDQNGGFVVDPAGDRQTQTTAVGLPGGGFAVLWTDGRSGRDEADVFAAPVSANGTVGASAAIARGAPAQVAPDLVAAAGGYFVVFESRVSGASRILGQRLDGRGAPIDLAPIEVASASAGVRRPAVAFDGTVYLVVWEDQVAIWGRRLGLAGNLLDPQPVRIMGGIDPDVAAQPGVFLVVDTHTPSNPQIRMPFAARVRATDGTVLDPVPIPLGQYFAQRPAVAAFGSRWLVAWQRHFSHDETRANIHAAFVDPTGATPGDFLVEAPFSRVLIDAAVATDGATSGLVLWNDATSPAAGPDVLGRIVLTNGTVLARATISGAAAEQSLPAVGWDGAQYHTVWQDRRNITFFVDDRKDVFGARVDAGGTVLDGNGFPVFDGVRPEIQPTVTGTNGTALFAAAIFEDRQPFAAYRIGIRLMNPPACAGGAGAFGLGCQGSGGFTPMFTVAGCPAPAHVVTFDLRDALGGSVAALALGTQRGATPLPGGCQLLVNPLLVTVQALVLSPGRAGGGTLQLPLPVPPAAPGTMLTAQMFVLDPGVARGFAASNGVEVTVR